MEEAKKDICPEYGDLFHENVPFSYIETIFSTIEEAEHHIFMILTKRPERMEQFITWYLERCSDESVGHIHEMPFNIWLGVTVENQAQADKRIPILLQIPAEKRFISVEPMLGMVELRNYLPLPTGHDPHSGHWCMRCATWKGALDWVICGGETGSKARPMHPKWVESLRDQCQEVGVPFFFKSWGEWGVDPYPPNSNIPYRMAKLEGGEITFRCGKKKSGRLLNECEWNETPEV